MSTATWRYTGVQHRIDYDSDNDEDRKEPGRSTVTRCGLEGWAAKGWRFTRIRRSRDGDRECRKCFP